MILSCNFTSLTFITLVLFLQQVRAVGVCNYNARQVEEMHGLLAKHGIPLASNQVCCPLLCNINSSVTSRLNRSTFEATL